MKELIQNNYKIVIIVIFYLITIPVNIILFWETMTGNSLIERNHKEDGHD